MVDQATNNGAILWFYSLIALSVSAFTWLLAECNIITIILHINSDLLFILVLCLLPLIYIGFVASQALIIRGGKTKAYFILNVSNAVLGGCLVFIGLYLENFFVLFSLVLIRPGVVSVLYFSLKGRAIFDFFRENISITLSQVDFRPVYGYYFYGVVSIMSVSIVSVLIRDKLAIMYGLEEIGYFFSAQRIFELVMGLSVSFYSTFYFNRLCRSSVLEAKRMVFIASVLSFVFFLCVAFTLNVFDEELIGFLLSSSQLPSVEYFFPLSINLLLNSLVYCAGFYILSFYDKRWLIGFELFFLLLTVFLIHSYSGKNIVWALPIVTFFKVLLNTFILYRKFSVKGERFV